MVGFLNLVENGKTAVLNLVGELTDAFNVLIISKFEGSKTFGNSFFCFTNKLNFYVMAQNGDKVTFWRGSIKVFNKLREDGRLTANRLYFVGNSQTDSEGLRDSTYGTIYLATSANWCVRFGIFSENSDLDKIANEIYTAIEKEGAERAKADGELQEKITAEATAREQAVNEEATAREGADEALSQNLSDEATARQTADTAIRDLLASDYATKTELQTAKTTLQNNIDAEATARQEADASLQTSIETEATARKNADDLKADKATTYTKTETNNLLDEKADASTTYSKDETDGLLNAKADASSVYTKSEVDTKVNAKADSDDVYTKTETDSKLNGKADSSSVYSKTETDTKLSAKADASSVYTKTQIDTKLNTKADSSALANYYTKSETYTKDEVDSLVEAKVAFQVVDTLPSTGETAIIYLVPLADPETQNIYDEYMWIGGAWEHIGSTKTDLSDYYTKEETDTKLDTKANVSIVYTKTETDSKLSSKADSSSVYTKTETSDLLSSKADSSSVYTKTETDTKLNAKANQSTTYTKTEVDTKLGNKANSADVYTQSQIDTKLNAKADKTALSSYYTKTESDSLLSAKQDSITGGATTITTNDLTASRVLVSNSDGKVAVSAVTTTELDYMQGVTANIQQSLNNKVETRNYGSFVQTTEAQLDAKLPKITPQHTTIHVSYNMSAPSGVLNYDPIFAPLLRSFLGVNTYTEEKFEYRVTMSDGSLLEGWIVANMYANNSVSGSYQRLTATGGGAFVTYMNSRTPYKYDLYYEGGNEGDASVYPSKIELWLPDTILSYGTSYNIWDGTKTSETEWGTYTISTAQEKTYSGCPWLSLGWADMTDAQKAEYCPSTHSGVLNYQLNKAYNMAKGEYYTKTQTDGYLEKKEDNLNTISTADIDTLIDSVCV